jgi:hypothetical protein
MCRARTLRLMNACMAGTARELCMPWMAPSGGGGWGGREEDRFLRSRAAVGGRSRRGRVACSIAALFPGVQVAVQARLHER